MIRVQCPGCQKNINAKDDFAGKKVKCPGCDTTIRIPEQHDDLISTPLPIIKAPQPQLVTPDQQRFASSPQIVLNNNIQLKDGYSNSIGISSLVLGVLSMFVCWMPFISWIVSGLGLLLGMIGISLAIFRKGKGVGYSIGGSVLSGTCLLIWIVFLSAVSQVAKEIKEADKPVAQRTAKAAEVRKSQSTWSDVSMSSKLGDIKATITSVTLGKYALVSEIGKDEYLSDEPGLAITISFTNLSDAKKISYSSYTQDYAASLHGLKMNLEDEHGNRYRQIGTSNVKGAVKYTESIYPQKSISDMLVFEAPVDAAKEFRLVMSGKSVSENGDFKLKIPREVITVSGQ
jgi:hypothetical protein